MKDQLKKVTNNPIGAIAGGVAVFYGAKKFANVENKFVLIGLALVGAVAGAMIQAKIKDKGITAAAIKK